MNPTEMVQMLQHPKESLINLCKNTSNPILNELIKKADEGDTQYLENFFRNIYKEKGLDFDKEMDKTKNLLAQFR